MKLVLKVPSGLAILWALHVLTIDKAAAKDRCADGYKAVALMYLVISPNTPGAPSNSLAGTALLYIRLSILTIRGRERTNPT
jgi:hypothetical protein